MQRRIDAIERGEAVAITLDARDKTEIATLGVVRLEVPRAFYVDHVKQLTGFLVSAAGSSSGTFETPAKLEDVAALSLDESDAKNLEKCQPLKCDVKLPAGRDGEVPKPSSRSRTIRCRARTRSCASGSSPT